MPVIRHRWGPTLAAASPSALAVGSLAGAAKNLGLLAAGAACGKRWVSRIGYGASVATGCPSWLAAAGTSGIHDSTAPAVNHWISDHDARDQAPLGSNARRRQPAGTGCWQLGRRGQEPLDCWSSSPQPASTICHVLVHGASVITGCPSWHAAAVNHWISRLDRSGREPLDLRSRCP